MRNEAKGSLEKVKELDVIIKSLKRRMKKHPEENHRQHIKNFTDEQIRELKRSVKEMEDFLTMDNEDEL